MSVNESNNLQSPGQNQEEERKETESAGKNFYEKWKDPGQNKMGNDVSSEIKIANSGGQREEGYNKEWHMEEDSEKGDEEIKKAPSSQSE
jgi:hypothetical protein